jgi:hypothetical protein
MKHPILKCRRSIIAIFAIGCLTYLGLKNGTDVSVAIAGIVAAVAGSNAYQGKGKE